VRSVHPKGTRTRLNKSRNKSQLCALALLLGATARYLTAQQTPLPSQPSSPSSNTTAAAEPGSHSADAPASGTITGIITDTDHAAIPNAHVTLEEADSKSPRTSSSDASGAFIFPSVPPGAYIAKITAQGFASWKIHDVILLKEGENFIIPTVELGVEAINTSVDAITMEDLAEQQITVQMNQRILGILPNFYVSYVPNAAPLTPRQKFKLAFAVTKDPVTFFTTGVTAGIEQWQNGFSGYGQGFSGYAQRYAAIYGDRLSSTYLGAALLPSLLHQDPRYFYRGHGKIVVRALYAISTVVVCKGDNGRWQPNYSNVFGNIAAAQISNLYYPKSDRHDAEVLIDNTLIGVATGAIGVLFQEFLLRHVTHNAPPIQPPLPSQP
jgi:Carboxypeptidase regulatory-like domain